MAFCDAPAAMKTLLPPARRPESPRSGATLSLAWQWVLVFAISCILLVRGRLGPWGPRSGLPA